jgi:sodium/hydrogen antiporter
VNIFFMPTFNPDLFLSMLALIGAVIVVSALTSGFIEKSGLPHVAIFLGLGAVIGPFGLNLLDADLHSPVLRVVAIISLVLVLFTDAMSLNWTEVRQHRLLSALVLGPGTLFSAVLIGLIGAHLLGLNPAMAAILGAALASTDPILLRGLLLRPGVDPGVRQALKIEGGLNDAVLLPVVLVGMTILSQGHSLAGLQWVHMGLNILVLSPAAGIIVGVAAVGVLALVRKRIGVRRDYESIYSLGIAFAAYAAAESVHGSGFIAAFAAGLAISGLDVELCDCFLEYGETTAEMALMFAFVLFGTSIIWSGLGILGKEMLLFTAAVFAARPAVFIPALLPSRLSWKNRLLVAWFGPTGLSSLLLVLLPVFAGIPGSERLLSICCLVVLFSVVLHGLSPIALVRNGIRGMESAVSPESPRDQAARREVSNEACCPEDTAGATTPAAFQSLTPSDPAYISIDEVRDQQRRESGILIIDARSERTYDESTEAIPGEFRLHPDRAVRIAEERKLPKDAILAVICA